MSFFKTDGGITVRHTNRTTLTEVILWEVPLTLDLSPDRVRFLGKALTELSEILDAEKEVTA